LLLKTLFPNALAACLLAVSYASALAQTGSAGLRHSGAFNSRQLALWEVKPAPISTPSIEGKTPQKWLTATLRRAQFERQLSEAIHQRLGAHYHWGGTGTSGFDCSGFVWSSFQSAGLKFERASARVLWTRFAPAAEAEQFKFGNLVFFSRRTHVGIVADEHGFYHASRHHGVVYSTFDRYWLSRIDGFRRSPARQ
jgi:cell wall-associated NlpC family hydrolase